MQCSWNYSWRSFGIPFGLASMPTLRGHGRIFRGNEERERRDEKRHGRGDESARRPTRKAARISGPFRRNAERAAVCPATKLKHRIVPISPLPWYFTFTWGEIPERSRSRNTPALSCGFTRLPENTAARRERKKERERQGRSDRAASPQRYRGKFPRDIAFYRYLIPDVPSRVRGSTDFFCGTVGIAWL